MVRFVLFSIFISLASIANAQQEQKPDCPTELAHALARNGQATIIATQDRDALIRFFQGQIAELIKERDVLKEKLGLSESKKDK